MTRMTGDETRTTASATARTSATTALPEHPGAPTRAWRKRLLVAGIVLAALNLRPAITSFGALLEEVRDGLGMSGSVAGLLTSLPALCFAVFGVTAPRLARRFGPGAVVCAGMAAIATGLLVRPFVGNTAAFLLTSGLALAGIAVSNVLMPVIVKRWFPDRVGSMTGLYSMALALGTASAAAATVPVTDALGGDWQAGLAVWAALAAAAVLPWLAFVRDRGGASAAGGGRRSRREGTGGRGAGRRAGAGAADHPEQDRLGAGRVLRTPGHRRLHQHGLDGADLPRRGRPRRPGRTAARRHHGDGRPLAFVIPRLAARLPRQGPIVLVLGVSGLLGYAGLYFAPAAGAWAWAVLVGIANCAFRSRSPWSACGHARARAWPSCRPSRRAPAI